jgi:hypothetical protein
MNGSMGGWWSSSGREAQLNRGQVGAVTPRKLATAPAFGEKNCFYRVTKQNTSGAGMAK